MRIRDELSDKDGENDYAESPCKERKEEPNCLKLNFHFHFGLGIKNGK